VAYPDNDFGKSSAGNEMTSKNPPITILQFLRGILRGMITGFLKNIPLMIVIAGIVWFLHVILMWLAVPTRQSGPASGIASLLVSPGNELIGAIFWLLMAWMVSTVIFQLRSRSFGKSVNNIRTIPDWLRESFHHSSIISLLIFSTGLLFALLIAALIQNIIVSLQLTLVSLSWLAAQKEGIMVVFLGVVWGRVSGLFSQRNEATSLPTYAGVGILGVSVGFLFSMMIPLEGSEYMLVFCLVLVFVAVLLLSRRRG
jgi:hypothetical protein